MNELGNTVINLLFNENKKQTTYNKHQFKNSFEMLAQIDEQRRNFSKTKDTDSHTGFSFFVNVCTHSCNKGS